MSIELSTIGIPTAQLLKPVIKPFRSLITFAFSEPKKRWMILAANDYIDMTAYFCIMGHRVLPRLQEINHIHSDHIFFGVTVYLLSLLNLPDDCVDVKVEHIDKFIICLRQFPLNE